MNFFFEYGLLGLFIVCFLSATVLPISSEILLSAFLFADFPLVQCILIATLGNFLGGVSTYYLGYLGKLEWIHKYLRIPEVKIIKATKFLDGKGSVFAFFAFLPVVGDIIPLIFGLTKSSPYLVFFYMALGKILRYAIITYIIIQV